MSQTMSRNNESSNERSLQIELTGSLIKTEKQGFDGALDIHSDWCENPCDDPSSESNGHLAANPDALIAGLMESTKDAMTLLRFSDKTEDTAHKRKQSRRNAETRLEIEPYNFRGELLSCSHCSSAQQNPISGLPPAALHIQDKRIIDKPPRYTDRIGKFQRQPKKYPTEVYPHDSLVTFAGKISPSSAWCPTCGVNPYFYSNTAYSNYTLPLFIERPEEPARCSLPKKDNENSISRRKFCFVEDEGKRKCTSNAWERLETNYNFFENSHLINPNGFPAGFERQLDPFWNSAQIEVPNIKALEVLSTDFPKHEPRRRMRGSLRNIFYPQKEIRKFRVPVGGFQHEREHYSSLGELAAYYSNVEVTDSFNMISLILSCRQLEKKIEEQNVVCQMLIEGVRKAQQCLGDRVDSCQASPPSLVESGQGYAKTEPLNTIVELADNVDAKIGRDSYLNKHVLDKQTMKISKPLGSGKIAKGPKKSTTVKSSSAKLSSSQKAPLDYSALLNKKSNN